MTDTTPIYGIEMTLTSLPIQGGGMLQALPTAADLRRVGRVCGRTAAGYEVLLAHYIQQRDLLDSLLSVIHGDDGQHTARVGLEQSVEDAKDKYREASKCANVYYGLFVKKRGDGKDE